MAVEPLGTENNFASLSTKDLLEARDQYHWHLINKANVVATAVGLYRIRIHDKWPSQTSPEVDSKPTPKPARTFENSEIRPYSWPCVLVFVDEWVELDQFGTGEGQISPDKVVPKTLYMPDGRTIPVCVVKVTKAAPSIEAAPQLTWPDSLVGGGFPLRSKAQGETNTASIGNLVTDGHTVYALTSRHVAGPKGHPVSTQLGGKDVEIGRSSKLQLTRLPFSEVYPDFVGRRTYVTLDAGLIEVKNLKQWTSRVYGLPEVGELADLSERNIGMPLINAEVVAYGATSGYLRGRIAALFFRHRSIGGYDDVTDFLIAPVPGQGESHPGDSGTVWHLVQAAGLPLRPIALQWGGQSFLSSTDDKAYNFALAAGLSNILRLLNVELVASYNMDAQPYWGRTGHYSIAAFATEQVKAPKLARFLAANQSLISFPTTSLSKTNIEEHSNGARRGDFVPLADVPDLVWKNLLPGYYTDKKTGVVKPYGAPGGRDSIPHKPEHPNHFANIDKPDKNGETLLQLCLKDPQTNVTVEKWSAFYASVGYTPNDAPGLLPFRVWQLFDLMVAALAKPDHNTALREFVATAGFLAHYVGDASQPLHSSSHYNGMDGDSGRGKGVHAAFEDDMVDAYVADIVAGMIARLKVIPKLPGVKTGRGAAIATVQLMGRSAKAIPPLDLINVYQNAKDADAEIKPRALADVMWKSFGVKTIDALSDSVRTLAMLWDSAWKVGAGDRFAENDIELVPQKEVMSLYEDPKFAPSMTLETIGAVLSTA